MSHRTKHHEFNIQYDDDSYRPMAMDARALTLPAISILALIGTSLWGAWTIMEERNRLDTRITAVLASVERLAGSVELLARSMETRTRDRFSKTEHELWCLRAANLNKQIGWRCPGYSERARKDDRDANDDQQSARDTVDSISKFRKELNQQQDLDTEK